jgi:hypothetical protein
MGRSLGNLILLLILTAVQPIRLRSGSAVDIFKRHTLKRDIITSSSKSIKSSAKLDLMLGFIDFEAAMCVCSA